MWVAKEVFHGLPHKRQVKFRLLFAVALCTQQPFLSFAGVQGLARPWKVLQRQWKDSYKKLLSEGNKTLKNHLKFFCIGYWEHFVAFFPKKGVYTFKMQWEKHLKTKSTEWFQSPPAFYDRLVFHKKCKMGSRHEGNSTLPFKIATISEVVSPM